MKRREAKSKGEKERNKHLNAEFQRIARRKEKKIKRNKSKTFIVWQGNILRDIKAKLSN